MIEHDLNGDWVSEFDIEKLRARASAHEPRQSPQHREPGRSNLYRERDLVRSSRA